MSADDEDRNGNDGGYRMLVKRKALMTKLNKSMANSRVKFKRKPSKSEIAG